VTDTGGPEKHTIAVMVENKFGVLSRVAGLFSARGYNIESLSVGETLDATVSRMTLVVKGDAFVVEQVIKQLHKLIDVIKVTDLSEENHVEREMLLVKVNAEPGARAEILRIGDIFRAKVVDVTPNTYTLEVTGEESKIEAIIELLRPFGIQELVRTGKVAIARGPKTRLRRVEEKLGKQRAAARPPAEDPKVVGFADEHDQTEKRESQRQAGQDQLRPGRRSRAAPRQEGRDHRLWKPGACACPEPQGLRTGRGRRPLQGLEELGQGGAGRSQGDGRGGCRPGRRHHHDAAA
jgi:acetolactate synthase-1/3 small subunit